MNIFIKNLSEMPEEKRLYILETLPSHLATAQQWERLREILSTFDFLNAKMNLLQSPSALLNDFTHLPKNDSLTHVYTAIRISAHILAVDASQFPGQLLARLLSFEDRSEIKDLLTQVRAYNTSPALLPLSPLQTQADSPLIRTLAGHQNMVNALLLVGDLLFSAGGGLTGVIDNTIKIWNWKTGDLLITLSTHSARINALAITDDATLVTSASEDTTLGVWDVKRRALLRRLVGHTKPVVAIAIFPQTHRAVSASLDQTLKIWDLDTGNLLSSFENLDNKTNALDVLRDGYYVVSGAGETFQLWDLISGETRKLSSKAELEAILTQLTGDMPKNLKVTSGHHLISSDGNYQVYPAGRTLRIKDLSQPEENERILAGHAEPISQAILTPDSHHAITTSSDYTIKIWDLTSQKTMPPSQAKTEIKSRIPSRMITLVALSYDGRYAALSFRENQIKVWDLKTGEIKSVLTEHTDIVNAIAMIGNTYHLISASDDKTVKLWDLVTGNALQTLKGHREAVHTISVTPDGRFAISAEGSIRFGANQGTLILWDVLAAKMIKTISAEQTRIASTIIFPDGRYAVSVAGAFFGAPLDSRIRLWDLANGSVIADLHGHIDVVNSVTLVPSAGLVISGSGSSRHFDHTVRVWNLQQGQLAHTFYHADTVNAVATTFGGHYALSVSDDRTLRAWDLQNGRIAATFTSDFRLVSCAATEDGLIITGDDEGQPHFLVLTGTPFSPDITQSAAFTALQSPDAAIPSPWWQFWKR